MRGKPVLFTSDRPLGRADNLKAVWDAYDGERVFVQYLKDSCKALCDDYSVMVTDEIPKYCQNKGKAKIIFVSHGLPGDKKYGLDCTQAHKAGASQIDFAVSTGDYCSRQWQRQLGLPPERTISLGMPITDRYVGKRKGHGGTILGEYRRAYLYVPTWRARGNPPLPNIDWHKVDSLLEEDEMIAVKRHMCTEDPLVGEDLKHVREFSNMVPSIPYIIDCDVLATDFSSILFDGYLCGKPSVLVIDGAHDYLFSHGMIEDYPSWYGSRTVCAEGNEEAFVDALRNAWGTELGEVERRCISLVAGVCDGNASMRVADLISRFA